MILFVADLVERFGGIENDAVLSSHQMLLRVATYRNHDDIIDYLEELVKMPKKVSVQSSSSLHFMTLSV